MQSYTLLLAIFPRIARPLTDAERARIERAHHRIAEAEEEARDKVRQAIADRDREIAAAVRAGARQTDIARALGISRQTVRIAVRRAEE
jgi:DNA-binding CsgD family transcriptional regulator